MNKEWYEKKFSELVSQESEAKFFIRESRDTYKTKLYWEKALKSFQIATFLSGMDEEQRMVCKLPEQRFLNYWIITISYYSMLYMAKSLIFTKGYETDDHFSTQIALGKLFVVTDELEKEDLEILNQSYKILEEEYVAYFENARKESRTARYVASKSYEQKRMDEVYYNAKKFIAKLDLMVEGGKDE